jgi:hypothetical protein
LVPHWLSDIVVKQVPAESQQPVAQLAEEHFSTQPPPVQVWDPLQVVQDPPPVPQSADDCCVWHCPSVPQHPVAHVDRPQATAPELLPDPELPLDEP